MKKMMTSAKKADDSHPTEETADLLSILGMRSSIRKGMREPASRLPRHIDL